MDWTEQTYTIHQLTAKAYVSDAPYAMEFLYLAKIIPSGIVWRRSNPIPRTNMSGDAIPAGYLAEVAFGWDKDGKSDPLDFIRALNAEIANTPTNTVIAETLGDLGRTG